MTIQTIDEALDYLRDNFQEMMSLARSGDLSAKSFIRTLSTYYIVYNEAGDKLLIQAINNRCSEEVNLFDFF